MSIGIRFCTASRLSIFRHPRRQEHGSSRSLLYTSVVGESRRNGGLSEMIRGSTPPSKRHTRSLVRRLSGRRKTGRNHLCTLRNSSYPLVYSVASSSVKNALSDPFQSHRLLKLAFAVSSRSCCEYTKEDANEGCRSLTMWTHFRLVPSRVLAAWFAPIAVGNGAAAV